MWINAEKHLQILVHQSASWHVQFIQKSTKGTKLSLKVVFFEIRPVDMGQARVYRPRCDVCVCAPSSHRDSFELFLLSRGQ